MIIKEKIKNIDINDKIFEELKLEYKDFNTWFNKLIENDEDCFITKNNDKLTSIMILKLNEKDSSQISYKDNVLKIRTLKVEDKNKGIGTSYMNIIHDLAVSNNIKYIYYTSLTCQRLYSYRFLLIMLPIFCRNIAYIG